MDKAKLFSIAEKAILKNQNDKALEALEKILHADPNDVKALNKAADLHLKKEEQEAALRYLHKVGELYGRDGFYSKAVAIYKRILKVEDGFEKSRQISTHEKLATLYGQLGLVSDAMNHFKIVVDFLDQSGDKGELLNTLKKVSDLDPNNVNSQLKLAELFSAEGREQDSIQTIKRLAEGFDPKKNLPELAATYEKWVELMPKNVEALQKLVEVYFRGGEPKKALAKLQRSFRDDPYNSEVLELLSSTFIQMNQAEKARVVDLELVKLYRKSGNAQKLNEVEGRMKGVSPELSSIQSFEPSGTQTRVSPEVGSHSKDSLDPGEALVAESLSNLEEKKISSECEVYLKYGLAEKAREVLSAQLRNFPKSFALRWKLKQVLEELDLAEELEHCLSEILLLAKEEKNQAWIDLSAKDLKKIKSNHPSLDGIQVAQVAARKEEKNEAEDEALDLGANDDSLIQSFDDSEISIVVDDEIISGEIDGGEFLNSEDEIEIQLVEPESFKEPEADLNAEDEGAEFILTEDDFSEEELQSLDHQLGSEEEKTIQLKESDLVVDESEAPDEILELSDDALVEISEPDGLDVSSTDDSAEAVSDIDFEVRQGLEEVAFFRSQNLESEASQLLETLKEKYPSFTGWDEELAKIAGSSTQAPATPLSEEEKASSPSINDSQVELEALGAKMHLRVQEDSRTDDEDDFFDLAAELESELSSSENPKKSDVPSEVADVFSAFKDGVSQSVSAEDFQTHYDLGIAYREMELIDDAIHEFELCSKIPGRKVTSLYQIGVSEVQRADYQKAEAAFKDALSSPELDPIEKLSVSYELAEVFLKLDKLDEAKDLFQEIYETDPHFREVKDRVESFQVQASS